jgi:hypothetical protein
MSNAYKAALLAALGLAGGVTAQAATYNGDLLIGFTTQSGNDTIVDLGAVSSLGMSMSWNLSSLLGGYNLNTVDWGIIGDKNVTGTGRLAWSTFPGALPNTSAWGTLDASAKAIYSNFTTAGSGQSLMITSADDNSWNQQTINGSLPTAYHNVWGNPNTAGLGTETLYQMLATGIDPVALGTFSLSSNGTLSFAAASVPEPATYGVLGGAGLLLVSLRSQLRRKVS